MALVRPIKEDIGAGFLEPVDLAIDGMASHGFYPQNAISFDQIVGIERDANNNLVLRDINDTRTLAQIASAATGVDFAFENIPTTSSAYSLTVDSGSKVINETWTATDTGLKLKTIDYTYIGPRINTETTKIYGANGSTVIGQTTITYTYAGSKITGYSQSRDI